MNRRRKQRTVLPRNTKTDKKEEVSKIRVLGGGSVSSAWLGTGSQVGVLGDRRGFPQIPK